MPEEVLLGNTSSLVLSYISDGITLTNGISKRFSYGSNIKLMLEPENAWKRTFKISNEFWYDFVDLAAARRLTQAELINQVIEDAVKDNLEEIDCYRSFFHKSFLKKKLIFTLESPASLTCRTYFYKTQKKKLYFFAVWQYKVNFDCCIN